MVAVKQKFWACLSVKYDILQIWHVFLSWIKYMCACNNNCFALFVRGRLLNSDFHFITVQARSRHYFKKLFQSSKFSEQWLWWW